MKKSRHLLKLAAIALFSISTIQTAHASWSPKAIISTFYQGRWGAQTFTVGGKVYVGGGYANNNINMNDLVSYDPSQDKWGHHNGMPGAVANRSGGISFTIDGKAYLGLGIENFNNFMSAWSFPTDLWQYDETSDTWTKKADFPGTGVGFAATFIIDNKLYVVGGQGGKFAADGTNQVYEYNPATDKWTKKADFPENIIISPFSFSLNNKGYIVGGENGSGNTNKTYEYDPVANIWTEKAPFPEAESNGGVAFLFNGKAYCGLGRVGTNKYLNYFWAYDANKDNWSYAAGFEFTPAARMYAITATIDNKIFIGAGWQYDGTQQHYYRDWHSINPNAALGIQTTDTDKNLNVYPNPATDILQFKADKKYNTYSLFSISGKLVATGTTKAANTIDVSTLSSGYYILQLKGANNSVQRAVTIK